VPRLCIGPGRRGPGPKPGPFAGFDARRTARERPPASQQLCLAGPGRARHPNQFGRLAALVEGPTSRRRPGSGWWSAQPQPRRGPARRARLHHRSWPNSNDIAGDRAPDRPETPVAAEIRGSASLMGCSCRALEAGALPHRRDFSASRAWGPQGLRAGGGARGQPARVDPGQRCSPAISVVHRTNGIGPLLEARKNLAISGESRDYLVVQYATARLAGGGRTSFGKPSARYGPAATPTDLQPHGRGGLEPGAARKRPQDRAQKVASISSSSMRTPQAPGFAFPPMAPGSWRLEDSFAYGAHPKNQSQRRSAR